jgi:hypothetical protein
MLSRKPLPTLAALLTLVLFAIPARAEDETGVGRVVMPRESCVLKIKDFELSLRRQSLPMKIQKVQGDWLWTGTAWVKSADVMPLAESIGYYSQCIARDPNSSWAYSCRGVARSARGDAGGARSDFDMAADLEPTDPTADPENIIEKFAIPRHGDFLLVPVRIAGRTYPFIVDTGSSWCVVDTSLSSHLVSTGLTGTVNGHPGVESYRLPDAQVGNSRLPITADVVCNDLSAMRKWSGYDIRGFLGMNFLMSYAISIDFDAGVLAILKHGPDSTVGRLGLSYANNGIPTIDFELPRQVIVPFRLESGMTGAGRFERETWSLISGTGRMTVLKRPGNFVTVHGEQSRREALVDRFALDAFEHTPLLFSEGPANSLGLDLLSRYAVTFDFPEKRVFLKPGRRFTEPPRFDMSGVAFSRVDGATFVEWVCRSSPAATAGILAGDKVVSVNGRRAGDYSLFELERLNSRAGRQLTLGIGGGQKQVRNVGLLLADWQHIAPKLGNVAVAPPPKKQPRPRASAEIQPAGGEHRRIPAVRELDSEIPELRLDSIPDATRPPRD